MKVLHVVATGGRRGAEVFAGDLVAALDDELDQRVAVVRADGYPEVRFDSPVDVLGSATRLVPGIRVDPRIVRKLRGLIVGWRPDAVQVHGGEPLKYALLARDGVPVVYRKIGLAAPRATRGPVRLGHARLMRKAARVVAVAESVRREAVEVFGAPEDRVVTIPNAVDPDRLTNGAGRDAVRKTLGIGGSSRVFLSLGALTWEKDPLAHVEIAKHILRRLPDAWHLIAGEGPLADRVRTAIARSDVRNRIRLLGSRSDASSLLRAADALLLASRTEGMPGCVIEAGLLGTPTVGFDVAGVREVVTDGATGLLALPGDTEGLSDRLSGLLIDGETRARLGRAAAERSKSFTIDRVAPRYASLYEEMAR